MLKIPTKVSVKLSLILAILFMVILISGIFFMPLLVNIFLEFPENSVGRNDVTAFDRNYVLVLGYAALTVMLAAGSMLLKLLSRVQRELVFTAKSVGLIRGVSWCAIILGVVFALLGWYFLISYFVAFACVFLGICIRVVKNVIEQATEIKSEHDYTI
ncbi:MAG: DUF2975 domain-containing protein [Clostridia bacterium]|nr:DUF2975 domain-containing protein [Clostridia bacterium]